MSKKLLGNDVLCSMCLICRCLFMLIFKNFIDLECIIDIVILLLLLFFMIDFRSINFNWLKKLWFLYMFL